MISATETVAFAAGAAVAAGGLLVDSALRPGSQVFGRTLIAGYDPAEWALTYDDGPNDRYTEELLALFAEQQVRATFFMIGRHVRERKELARRVLAAGHVVGNHTLTHPWLAWQSAARVREELRVCNEILEDTLGVAVRYFRPPHGARRPVVLRAARELGMATVQWNAMGVDWTEIGPERIVANLGKGIARSAAKDRGANLLLHDGSDVALGADRSATVAATAQVIARAKAEGKRFVTVNAWG